MAPLATPFYAAWVRGGHAIRIASPRVDALFSLQDEDKLPGGCRLGQLTHEGHDMVRGGAACLPFDFQPPLTQSGDLRTARAGSAIPSL